MRLPSGFLARILLAIALLVPTGRAMAQSSIGNLYWLDPDDFNAYGDFTRHEYTVATTMDGPKAAAQILENQKNTVSMIPTPETGQTGSDWWQVQAPTWWKRMTQGTPGSSQSGDALQNKGLSELFMGLSYYQRMRATLRASALMYQSLKGLRFEVNAWDMMKDLLVLQEGQTFTDKSGNPITIPSGVVSVSIVPKGSEKWRDVVKVFNDEPWDDPNHPINYLGPTKLSDVSIDANEIGGDPNLAPTNAVQDLIQRMDYGTEAAAEGLMDIQTGVDDRRKQALVDSMSPSRLAMQVHQMNSQMLMAYGSILDLRALLEGRSRLDIQRDYDDLVAFSDQQVKAAEAQTQMSAKFYKDELDSAANVVAELEEPKRQQTIAELEQEYEALFNLSSHGDGVVGDTAKLISSTAAFITQEWPAAHPYLDGLGVVTDTVAVATGATNQADNDARNPLSDIQGAFRDAKIRALAVRFNYELWQELRGARRLIAIEEQVKAANSGLDDDVAAERDMGHAIAEQNERASQLYRLKVANDVMQRWANHAPSLVDGGAL